MSNMQLAMEVGNWTKADVIIGGVGAALLLIVLGFNLFALRTATRSANEAKRANDRADEEMITRLQPYLAIHMPEQARGSIFKVPVTNHGSWPANNIDIFVACDKDLNAALERINENPLRERNAIYGGDTFQQSVFPSKEDWTEGWINGDYPVHVVGRVTYYDPRTERRWRVEASYSLQGLAIRPVKVGIPELLTEA